MSSRIVMRHPLWLASLALSAVFPLHAQEPSPPKEPAEPGTHHDAHKHGAHTTQDASPAPQPKAGQEVETSPHMPPEPPSHSMPPMSSREMARMMQMDDESRTGQVLIEQLEWLHSSHEDSVGWEGQGWYGNDYDKLWIKSEGEHGGATPGTARLEVLWDHIITPWWSFQIGARADVSDAIGGGTTERTWAAIGLQGLATGWFDVEATVYIGEQGRTAMHLKSTYDLLLSQRLILQPQIEADIYDRADPDRLIGAGLSELRAGLRLRYEVRRELAPYIGLAGTWRLGGTADRVAAAGFSTDELAFVVGVRAWY